MRLSPRAWSTETWWCSIKGHVAPAAHVATISEADSQLALATADDTRLCRCLRCDAWINYAQPRADQDQVSAPVLPQSDRLPTPQRGKALDETVVIRVIALQRGLHVVFFLAVAILLAVVEWGLPGLQDSARQLLASAQGLVEDGRPGNSLLVRGLQELTALSPGHVVLLVAVFLAYAALEGVEGVFLWKGRRWAEYLTVVGTAALLPLALLALAEKISIPRILGVVIDLAILGYLIWTKRLFGVRGGFKALERALNSDVDWTGLHAHAPVASVPSIKAALSSDPSG